MPTKKLKRCKKGTRRNPKTKRCRKTKSSVKVKLSEDDLHLVAFEKGLIVKRDDSIPSKVKKWMKSIPFSTKSEQFYKYDPSKSDADNLYWKVSARIDSYRKDGDKSVDLTDVRDLRRKSPVILPTVKYPVTLSEDDLQLIAYEQGLIVERDDTIKPEVKAWMKSIPFSTIADDDEQFYNYDPSKNDRENL